MRKIITTLLFIIPAIVCADTKNIVWGPPESGPEPDGYILYYADNEFIHPSDPGTYLQRIDVGNALMATATLCGKNACFGATAYKIYYIGQPFGFYIVVESILSNVACRYFGACFPGTQELITWEGGQVGIGTE